MIPSEVVGDEDLRSEATPITILIEDSNGASDYGNKFDEPLIGGFIRTFGQNTSKDYSSNVH